MPISLTVSNESADLVLADLQRLFPSLVAGTQLPPMQEQPRENREPQGEEEQIPRDPPKERKTRTKPPKDTETTVLPPENVKEVKTEGTGESSGAETAGDAASASESIPDIDDVRARLKTLGATEGFGHDKVFEVLGNYKATNASSVPADKRAALIAEIDEMLKGAK